MKHIIFASSMKVAAIATVAICSASIVQATPLTLISHSGLVNAQVSESSGSGSGGGSGGLGGPVIVPGASDSDSDTPASALDPLITASALITVTASGTGGGSLFSASASAQDGMTATATSNIFDMGHGVTYMPGTGASPATALADVTASWMLNLDTTNVDLTYGVSRLGIGSATTTTNLTVRNMTTGAVILSLTDPGTIASTTLNFSGSIGDIIAIDITGQTSYMTAGGSSIIHRTNLDLEFADTISTVPEPAALALFAFGIAGLCLVRRRKR